MKWYALLTGIVLGFAVHSASYAAPAQQQPFTTTYTKILDQKDLANTKQAATPNYIWEHVGATPFTELIFSWNAFRPTSGKLTFYASVRHKDSTGKLIWSPWHRFAEWAPRHQRTFINKKNSVVHTKHVRVELQKGVKADGFRIKVQFEGNASPACLAALFASASDLQKFRVTIPSTTKPTTIVRGVPRQSQMVIDHPRRQDLCSPTSASMLIQYFARKLNGPRIEQKKFHDYVVDFASKVHDKGIDIYGNWLLNVAQAFDSSDGAVLFRVSRLNGFDELYHYIQTGTPIAVSVRSLPGGATPYRNGHFLVVIGWDSTRRAIICIDPAFGRSRATLRSYPVGHFLRAWGRSFNLAYIPMPTAAD